MTVAAGLGLGLGGYGICNETEIWCYISKATYMSTTVQTEHVHPDTSPNMPSLSLSLSLPISSSFLLYSNYPKE
jgi:hypothetical protein